MILTKLILWLSTHIWPWTTLTAQRQQILWLTESLRTTESELAHVRPYDSKHLANWMNLAQSYYSETLFTESEREYLMYEYREGNGWREALAGLRIRQGRLRF